MGRTVILTDSTCDLPSSWVQEYDIRVVPTFVQFGTESLADDGVQLTRVEFYTRLESDGVQPTTAAPSLGQTTEIMRKALTDGEQVIAITAPAHLSGLHNIFRLAAERTDPTRVTLIDSMMLSMGSGWQVIKAAELARDGVPGQQITQTIRAMQPRLDVWAALDTMEYLRRSGRVNWAQAFVGNLFRIKPIVRMHMGQVSSAARVRTKDRAFDQLVRMICEAAPLDRLAVMHSNNLEHAQKLLDAIADIRPAHEVPMVDVTPVLGVHVGPRGIGVAVQRRNET